jgi:hypothetical protein
VHPPVLLDACGSHDRSLNTLVHEFGNFDACCDLVLVLDTVEKLLVAWLAIEVDLRAETQLSDFATVHVSHLDRGILEKLLNQHKDERDLTPLLQKGPLERLELRSLVQKLALANDKLVQTVFVHQLVVVTCFCSDDLLL